MIRGENYKGMFNEKRLIFQERPDPLTEAVRKSVEAGKNADREAAVAKGRELGGANQPKPWETPSSRPAETTSAPAAAPGAAPSAASDQSKPWEAPRPAQAPQPTPGQEGKTPSALPELPPELKWLKVENGVPNKDNPNSVEYTFNFGENSKDLTGKIIMPSNPKEGVKPVMVFNYVKDPDKIDPKLLKAMQENANLQNAIVVTLKTPSGETKVDDKMVNNMYRLTGELEKWQQEMAQKDPKNKPFSLRAEQILQIADSDSGDRVFTMLEKYRKSPNADQRIVQYPPFDNNPENFAANLQKALSQPAETQQDQQPADQNASPPARVGGGGGGGGGAGGGGTGGGGGGGGEGGGGESAPTGQQPEVTSVTKVDSPGSTPEVQGEGVNKLIILGDSLMYGAQGMLKANDKNPKAVVGKMVQTIAREFSSMDLTPYRNETMVFNGGVNDIANFAHMRMTGNLEKNPEYRDFKVDPGKPGTKYEQYVVNKILDSYKTIWSKARENNIKIFQCTAPPFLAADPNRYRELNPPGQPEIGKENEEIRKMLNQEIENAQKSGSGPSKVIPLHQSKDAGGLASNEDSSKMFPDYLAGDGLHLSDRGGKLNVEKTGYERMAEIIQSYIGNPIKPGGTGAAAGGGGTPEVQPGNPGTPLTLDVRQPGSGGEPRSHFESGKDYADWASATQKRLIAEHLPYEKYVKVEYQGKPLLGILRDPNGPKRHTNRGPGTIGFETYEYDAALDPEAQKKSPETVKGGVEKQPDLMNGKVDFYINSPPNFNPALPTELVIYATPNKQDPLTVNGPGNQIGRQADLLRNSRGSQNKNIIIAYVSPLTRDWPNYLNQNASAGNEVFRAVMDRVKSRFQPRQMDVSFDSHSGGGAFAFNVMNSRNEIPPEVKHLDFFDSLYFYQTGGHARMIKEWLDRSPENTFTLVAGTPQINDKQKALISDLEKLGVQFTSTGDQPEFSEQAAYNGRIRIKTLKMFDHGGTVTRNGFAYAHDPQNFDITSRVA